MPLSKSPRFFGVCVSLSLILLIAIFSLNNSATSSEFNEFYLNEVPYTDQGNTYWCGPASLSTVLNYWGCNVTMSNIASQIYDPLNRFTTIANMTLYPQILGFDTASATGSIDYLQFYIQKGIPLIVLQKFSLRDSYGHYRVVVGYNAANETVITYDPINGKDYVFSYNAFADLWKPGSTFSTYNWTLVITPKNKILTNLMQKYQVSSNQEHDLEKQNEALINAINNLKILAYTFIGVSVVFVVVTSIYYWRNLRILRQR